MNLRNIKRMLGWQFWRAAIRLGFVAGMACGSKFFRDSLLTNSSETHSCGLVKSLVLPSLHLTFVKSTRDPFLAAVADRLVFLVSLFGAIARSTEKGNVRNEVNVGDGDNGRFQKRTKQIYDD